MSEEKRTCSFCGKSENDVKNLIEGEHAFICNECVETCGLMLQDNESGEIENEFAKAKEEKRREKTAYPCRNRCQPQRPRYRQEHAKKALAVSVYNHYKTPAATRKQRAKSNCLNPISCLSALPAQVKPCWRNLWRANWTSLLSWQMPQL